MASGDGVDSSSLEMLSLTGYLYLQHGKARQAISVLRAVEILAEDKGWARRALAYAYLLNEDFQKCLDQVARLSGAATDAELQLMRSRALWGLGREDEARQVAARISGSLRGEDGRQ